MVDADGTVYITSNDKKAYALNGQTGGKLWEFTAGDAIKSTPGVVNGRLFFGAEDHKVYALDAKTGAKLWEFTTGDRVVASVAPLSDTVYAASVDHRLYALDSAKGAKKWDFLAGGQIFSSPAVAPNGTVYFGSDDMKLYAVDGGTGMQLWTFQTGGPISAGPAVGLNNFVYVGSDDGVFHALDAAGSQVWQFDTGAKAFWNSAAVIFEGGSTERVFAGNSHTLVALDATTGAVIWRDPPWFLSQYVTQPAVVRNGLLFLANANQFAGSFLFAADSATGTKKWQWFAGIPVLNSPAVGPDGIVYVTSGDGKVYAFK